MAEETQTIEEGAGFYDFEELMGEKLNQEEEERELDVPKEEEKEEESKEEEAEKSEEEKDKETPQNEEETLTEDESKEKEDKTPTNSSSHFKDLTKKYIEKGIWQDAEVEIDGEEVQLSEIEDLDEETFLSIAEAQEEEKNNELEQKYINKDELDDISLKIIDISKNGGNINEVLKAKETYIDNLNTYDLDNEQHQEALVQQMYKLKNPELSDKQISNLIDTDKEELVLDEKAKSFADNLKQSYNTMLEKEKEKAVQAKEQKQQDLKALRKDLKESIKEFGITESSAINPLLDTATKETEEGLPLDKQFEDLKKNPKELAEFLIWKNNREDYKKVISEKETSKTKKDAMLKLNLLRGKNKNSKPKQKEEKSDLMDELASQLDPVN